MSCVVKGCRSHTGRTDIKGSVTFHTFPKNEEQKDIWLRLVDRPSWTWNKRSRICSKHFTEDSFLPNTNIKWRRLNSNALPILNMPEESMDTGKIHKQQANDDLDNESEASSFTSAEFLISNKEDSSYQISKNKQQSLKPICYQHLATISKLQREIEKVKKVSSRRLKKINSLSKRYSRLNKQHYNFVCMFMDKLKKGNIDTEYLTLLSDLKKIGH